MIAADLAVAVATRGALAALFVLAVSVLTAVIAPIASAQTVLAGPWFTAEASKVRLIAGTIDEREEKTIYAGVQLRLDYKWKTYWRSPGEAGGVPPRFDFSKSENIVDPQVLYPAPLRFPEPIGETIGYHSEVVFPVRFKFKDARQPAVLKADVFYGICKDICIPIETTLTLTVPAEGVPPAPPKLQTALLEIPRTGAAIVAADPKLLASDVVLAGATPHILFEVQFPANAVATDAFIETTTSGHYVPQPSSREDLGQGRHRFVVNLADHGDLADLQGVNYRITLVGEQGQSEYIVAPK